MTSDKEPGKDKLPRGRGTGFRTARGCAMTGGAFRLVLGIAAAEYHDEPRGLP